MTLELHFEHRGGVGVVRATIETNQDPVRWGYREQDFGEHLLDATDFPVCHATVQH